MPRALLIRRGRVFGRWTVVRETSRSKSGIRRHLCQCECGKTGAVEQGKLVSGHSSSCGCLRRETSATINRTHGASRTPEHMLWKAMVQRCTNPHNKSFRYYGGRGIAVCAAWRHDFLAFLRDVGPRPSPKMELDRIENGRGYEPGNVRWTSHHVQMRNTRRNVTTTIGGKTLCAAEWALKSGIPSHIITQRLAVGRLPTDAVYTPVGALIYRRRTP